MSDEIKPIFFDDEPQHQKETTQEKKLEPITSFFDHEREIKPIDFGDEKSDFIPSTSIIDDDDDDFVSSKPTTIINKESNFISFFGSGESGKSVILSSMLYAMQTKYGVLSPKIGTPNTKEAEVLLEEFFENISRGILPGRTTRDQVTRMDLVFKPNNKSKKVPPIDLTFLETSGENWNEIRRAGMLHSSIDAYLSADIPLTFILVTGYRAAHREDALLKKFLFLLEQKRHNLNNTNVILVISKWDQSGSQHVSSEEELDNFVQEKLPLTHNFLETNGLAKTYYTIGELYSREGENRERIKNLNLDSAYRLSKWLYKSITGVDVEYQGTFGEQLKWSLGLK
ncbi:GTPase domain-containing protein [Riemerella columbina]|uniref:GTPase domain-containing protein n=1 Tax=Riemerella columbina TaxID=103810 RepID=UPI00267097A6|nr:GTPase domain-containing protein [Riemerella columbina]WKS94747.1 GTPase domain-containing protein [Riemerella columbina]